MIGKRGFTLVELVVVLVIMMLGLSMVAPALFREDGAPPTALDEVVGVLNAARLAALRCSCVVRLQMDGTARRWILTELPVRGPRRVSSGELPPATDLENVRALGERWIAIEFSPLGQPEGIAPIMEVRTPQHSFRIRISPNSGTASVEVE